MNANTKLISVPGHWDITYNYSAGVIGSEFLRRLRDEQRISGRKCPKCARVLLPARGFCDRCFVDTTEWVDAGESGTIEVFTITTDAFLGLPEPPYAIAYVLLKGASTAMVNFVRNVDLSDIERGAERLAIGNRVRVVWEPQRHGRITDFYYELES
ncbi:MAG: Zn-ribbon domain-containing OB-fold protein [Planctomycetaceae bacterium]